MGRCGGFIRNLQIVKTHTLAIGQNNPIYVWLAELGCANLLPTVHHGNNTVGLAIIVNNGMGIVKVGFCGRAKWVGGGLRLRLRNLLFGFICLTGGFLFGHHLLGCGHGIS